MHIFQMKKRMQKTMESTRFAGCPIIPVAAKPGGPEVSTYSFNTICIFLHSRSVTFKKTTII